MDWQIIKQQGLVEGSVERLINHEPSLDDLPSIDFNLSNPFNNSDSVEDSLDNAAMEDLASDIIPAEKGPESPPSDDTIAEPLDTFSEPEIKPDIDPSLSILFIAMGAETLASLLIKPRHDGVKERATDIASKTGASWLTVWAPAKYKGSFWFSENKETVYYAAAVTPFIYELIDWVNRQRKTMLAQKALSIITASAYVPKTRMEDLKKLTSAEDKMLHQRVREDKTILSWRGEELIRKDVPGARYSDLLIEYSAALEGYLLAKKNKESADAHKKALLKKDSSAANKAALEKSLHRQERNLEDATKKMEEVESRVNAARRQFWERQHKKDKSAWSPPLPKVEEEAIPAPKAAGFFEEGAYKPPEKMKRPRKQPPLEIEDKPVEDKPVEDKPVEDKPRRNEPRKKRPERRPKRAPSRFGKDEDWDAI